VGGGTRRSELVQTGGGERRRRGSDFELFGWGLFIAQRGWGEARLTAGGAAYLQTMSRGDLGGPPRRGGSGGGGSDYEEGLFGGEKFH